MSSEYCASFTALSVGRMSSDGSGQSSQTFNLLDARSVISVTERANYFQRVRALLKECGEAFLLTDTGGAAAA